MLKTGIKFICSLLLLTNACQESSVKQKNNFSSSLQVLHNPASDQILVVAHRALHTFYPENSLAAVRQAIDSGLDMIEIDVRRTKDGVLVLMHDEKVDRTTDGSGRISDLSYMQVQQLSLKKNSADSLIHRVPTLLEVLQLTKNHILVDLDIKAAPLAELVALVRKTGTMDQVLFFQHYNATHDSLLAIDSTLMITPRADTAEDVLNFIAKYHPVSVQIPPEIATPALVRQMKEAGCAVWINALGAADRLAEKGETETAFRPLIEKGANLIQGDQPLLLSVYLSSKHLHW
jgi:glycerophosphoryl diester phosphodiesterase